MITILIFTLFSQSAVSSPACDNIIYCKGPMYSSIQNSLMIPEYVFQRINTPPKELLKKFDEMASNKKPSEDDLLDFVDRFYEMEVDGIDFEPWVLPDKNISSEVMEKLNDRNLVLFVQHLSELLPSLAIQGTANASDTIDRYSLLSTNGFIKRHKDAREALYWDTYYVVNGLLVCEMYNSAKALIDNLIQMVKKYGFVPRGNRIFYTKRSHPPMLTIMAYNFFNKTKDREWLTENIEYLDKELNYWVEKKRVSIKKGDKTYSMYRYAVDCTEPRPESYRLDTHIAEDLEDKASIYRQIHSASESGWDFSARWLFDQNGNVSTNLADLQVTRVIPVDLNSYLYKAFERLSKLYELLRDKPKQSYWAKQAKALAVSIKEILWNEQEGIWNDYDMKLNKHRNHFFISNFMPLWAEAFERDDSQSYGKQALGYLKRFHVLDKYKGGIPATLVDTQESYDYPNSFSHLQIMLIQGLRNTGYPEAIRYASILFMNWMDAVLSCWSETRSIFDTYNAVEFGQHITYNDWTEDHSITVGAFLEILADYYILETKFYSNGSQQQISVSVNLVFQLISLILIIYSVYIYK